MATPLGADVTLAKGIVLIAVNREHPAIRHFEFEAADRLAHVAVSVTPFDSAIHVQHPPSLDDSRRPPYKRAGLKLAYIACIRAI